jgi:sigma-E factor negative regulatory protein RseC
MPSNSEIEHRGVVCDIGSDSITVKITVHPACSSCHASGICNASGSVDKYFTLPVQNDIANGQEVRITTSLTTGFRALWYGYLFPMLVLIISLIVLISSGLHEVLAGITSIVLVLIYYLMLYMMRYKIDKMIKFTLKPA